MLPHPDPLEIEIDRQLKALPELAAPGTLMARVMKAIAENQALPWFRRAWQTWPPSLRLFSFTILSVLFAGLCYGIWELSHVARAAALAKYGPGFSVVESLWNALAVLGGAVVTVVSHLDRGLLLGCLGAMVLAYAMCIALGTLGYALVRNVRLPHDEN